MRRAIALMSLVLLTGCETDLDTTYGTLHGPSVNGVRVFADLLRADGHRVGAASGLTPSLWNPDIGVLVLFLDEYDRLDPDVREYLEEWLAEEPDRTVLLVLRDSASEIAYWEEVIAHAGAEIVPDERSRMETKLRLAKASFESNAQRSVQRELGDWYGLDAPPAKGDRVATRIEAAPEWTDEIGLVQGKLDLRFHRRLRLDWETDELIAAGPDVLLAEMPMSDGRVLLVANGSFLLNYPLINHEHRKLAGALSRYLGQQQRIVFVLSTAIVEETEDAEPGLWAFVQVPPINWIAGHLVVLSLLYCLYRLPIFGRPKVLENREVFRFGRHIDALAAMLATTRDEQKARERIESYLRQNRPDTTPESRRS